MRAGSPGPPIPRTDVDAERRNPGGRPLPSRVRCPLFRLPWRLYRRSWVAPRAQAHPGSPGRKEARDSFALSRRIGGRGKVTPPRSRDANEPSRDGSKHTSLTRRGQNDAAAGAACAGFRLYCLHDRSPCFCTWRLDLGNADTRDALRCAGKNSLLRLPTVLLHRSLWGWSME